ncbi:MAG: hypothetical protein IJ489_04345 [Clostridia bacterium]|nr:hypothetical protein [Clostridia bacterium]
MENTRNNERKTSRSFRLCLLLMALALMTFSLALGTIARYSTSGGVTESARVAKFGVTIKALDDSSFKTEYKAKDGTITVQSSTEDKIVAPGTADGGITFTVKGEPEVNTRLSIAMTANEDIFYRTEDLEYHPVIFKLSRNGKVLATGNITEVEEALNDYTVDYKANDKISAEYTLSWEWPYHVDEKSDAVDTVLGDLAVGFFPGNQTDEYSLDVAYTLTISVYQVVD